jgi:carbamoyltransferase
LINACVKYREAFRPFAPAMLYEAVDDYLVNGREEPYMITSFDVKPEKQDKIPAVVHVDGTSRPQTVRRETNPRYYDLIKSFGNITGENVILNTSFNVKGEPIICHPREAIKCFFDTGLDVLVLGDFLLKKPI